MEVLNLDLGVVVSDRYGFLIKGRVNRLVEIKARSEEDAKGKFMRFYRSIYDRSARKFEDLEEEGKIEFLGVEIVE